LKTGKLLGVVLVIVMLFSTLAWAGQAGNTYTGTAPGFGGDITVTITVDNGRITACTAEGHQETLGIGTRALERLPQAIAAAGSVDVDVVTGATATSNAIILAASQALAKAADQASLPPVRMKPGTYTAQGRGFSLREKISVDVTVNEEKIIGIKVDPDNGETPPILQWVIDKLIPRMLAYQSVTIDAITGATASSAGVREAVVKAVTEALAAGGSDAAAMEHFYNKPPVSIAKETLDVDVLVVGLGGSGVTCALRAAECMYDAMGQDASKVNVLAIDKAGKYGGTSSITHDTMAINAPRLKQKFNDGKDYVDAVAFKEDWIKYTRGDVKEDLLDMFFAESGKLIDWLHFDHGFLFGEPTTGFTETDIWRIKHQAPEGKGYGNYQAEVGVYYDNLMKDYEKLGGKYMLETVAYELIYDQTANRVKGVKARCWDGTEYTINAKAVVLATGGFIGNPDMHEKYFSNEYFPLKGKWNVYGMRQNDGKMVQAAIDIGAGTWNIDMVPMVHVAGGEQILTKYDVHKIEGETDFWTFRTATWSLNDVPIIMTTAPNVIQLNQEGKRFFDESAIFQTWRAGPKFYTIWSEDQIKKIEQEGFTHTVSNPFIGQGGVPAGRPVPEIHDILQTCMDMGFVYKGDTLDEVASRLGMNANNLKETIARYNQACAKGVDEEFGKDAKYLDPISGDGPFYAVVGASYPYSTCGALDVNPKLQVLKEDGITPINGLYAVGTDSMGGLFTNKTCYVTYGGAAQGWAFTSGKVAGENVVDFVLKK
jgi:uncharacterized protein with FMN-binding domain/succinate dehydrogenase/fumarate reductase flavoprotein subunit